MFLQVSVVASAEGGWEMLPSQARSISSDQVQMQQQQSLVSAGSYLLMSSGFYVLMCVSCPLGLSCQMLVQLHTGPKLKQRCKCTFDFLFCGSAYLMILKAEHSPDLAARRIAEAVVSM